MLLLAGPLLASFGELTSKRTVCLQLPVALKTGAKDH